MKYINKVSRYENEYKFSNNLLTWEKHEAEAQDWGGHLTSILSEEEDYHIQKYGMKQ